MMDLPMRLNDAPLSVKLVGLLVGVVGIGIGVSYALTSQLTTQEFAAYSTSRGLAQARMLSPFFAEYYREVGNWEGIEGALGLGPDGPSRENGMGHGMGPRMMGPEMEMGMMMGPQMWGMAVRMHDLLLTDAVGRVVLDPGGAYRGETFPLRVLDAAGTPIEVGDQRVGWLVVASALNQFNPLEREYLGSVRRAILVAGAAAAGVALLLGGLFLRGVTTPLRRLHQAARRVAHGNLSQRVAVHSQDEVGRLAQTFNEMASRLEHSEQLRRRMIQDIAHELRTPLTVIQGDLQAMVDGVYQPTRATIASIHEESLLLARLIHDLRELSLAEAGELRLERQGTDLVALIEQGTKTIRPQLAERGVELALELPQEHVEVHVDPDRIAQVLANLLSNAGRHTPEGGRITVGLERRDGGILIRVADTGPGIPSEDLPFVFERFWKGDRSRTRANGGTGLGLAIAKHLVEAHGGRIWVEDAKPQGAIFTWSLPVNRPEQGA